MSQQNKFYKCNYVKQTLPIIVLLDVLVLLLFAYIAMPHKDKDISFFINFDNGIMDNAVLEIRNSSKQSMKQYLIQHGQLKKEPESNIIPSWYGGFNCKLGSKCSTFLQLEKRNNSKDYIIIFPDKVMTPAFALWHNFCKKEKCNGGIYIEAFNGNTFICSKDGFLKYYDGKQNNIVSSNKKCNFTINEVNS